ncbi:hypothetical protein L218DRAFT_946301 [Marasmius fiardii PR-910]|nr:hypothetical protein L218DRAFT_946301 [Marasmius fiardii PR-910]
MFSKATLAVTLPLLVSSALAGDCLRRYTVVEGDTCNGISAANNVSTYQLATINAGHIDQACSNLQPGDSICLGYENEDCTSTYVVQADDTCDAVVQAHSIDMTSFIANNPQINDQCNNMYIGEVLCVLNEIRVPPTPAGGASSVVVPPANAAPASSSGSLSSGSDSSDDSTDDDDDSLPFCDEIDN